MATAVAPPTTAKTTTSVDPLYVQAVAQAKAALAAQQAPVQNEQAASDAYYKQRGTDATDNAAALSELLKGIAPATQGIYQNAEQNQELAASGFSQGMQDALKGNADNLNSMLDKLGSPAKLDSHAGEAGDVLYGLGGYIPGETFNREGAAFAAAAAQLPANALLHGQENAQTQRMAGDSEHAKFDAKLQEMAAKLPGDVQTNYQKLQSLSLANKRFALAVQNQRFTQAYKIASQKLQVAKYNTGVAEFNTRTKITYAKMQVQASQFAQRQFNSDRSYGLSLGRLGIAQKKLQMSIVATAFKEAHGGFSPQQLTKYETEALGFAQSSFHGTTKTNAKGTYVTGKLSYGDAMTGMLKKGWPVQTALNALDQVYGKPNADQEKEIAAALGPLTPASLQATLDKNQGGFNYALGTIPTTPLTTAPGRPIPREQLPAFAAQVLRIAAPQYATNVNVQALVGRIMQESGGNPTAVNNWDSNAKKGTPSKGILQTIDSTFNTYKLPGHNDIFNPFDNAIAAVRYMLSRYGKIVGPSGSGY